MAARMTREDQQRTREEEHSGLGADVEGAHPDAEDRMISPR